jgi:hypothetical protein
LSLLIFIASYVLRETLIEARKIPAIVAPARGVFDYAAARYLQDLPLHYALTVTTAPGGKIHTHGLYIGKERTCFEQAVSHDRETNLTFVDAPLRKVVVFLDGGELIVLAPGVDKFGEDPVIDGLIRKYGYAGRETTIRQCAENRDLRDNLSAAAHLIHGSSDGRFSITYGARSLARAEIEGAHFNSRPYDEAAALQARQAHRGLQHASLRGGVLLYSQPRPRSLGGQGEVLRVTRGR